MHDYHTTTLLSSSTHPATTETPTLSLHDALPISAPADFLSAVCSSGENFTSTIFSSPVRPSLHGTPQYIPESPYSRSEEHTSELQSRLHLVCRLLLEKKKNRTNQTHSHVTT